MSTTDITCDCTVCNSEITIRVPSGMLVNPKPGAKTTPKYVRTVKHNLIGIHLTFRQYERVV